ncbi:GIY-YIG nuclease family protein [Pseudoalteromonas sp. SR44-5]|uniref:GIY-YIG nuclease family protein n=1 Tax=unclassified Pseudoalteromonas TaxID=194690 RepID=UPI0016042CD5|nr:MULTISPECIES: GIY-YIG nuclease family protein [unclassified Pseudoalteromonas]MBB1368101.1 GIY-YIG nuclease family protein [Pseudoalteromonas sp. SR44-5]MBB1423256.1 GIY-YIG nuclease family protein [Pseudoalteromonas sp. SG43-7]
MKFSKLAKESLGCYVYCLIDPSNNEIFYIGKASKNNRAFDHLKEIGKETDKSGRISDIRAAGEEPRVEILRYGLDESTAFEVEAAIIDTIGLENLTNAVRGHGIEKGRSSVDDIERLHSSKPLLVDSIKEKCILFYINQTYSPTLSEPEIYDMTRQFWYGVSEETRKNNKYNLALAVVDGVVVQVYTIEAWFEAGSTLSTRVYKGKPNKWEFIGQAHKEHYLRGRMLINSDGKPIPAMQQGYSYLPKK